MLELCDPLWDKLDHAQAKTYSVVPPLLKMVETKKAGISG